MTEQRKIKIDEQQSAALFDIAIEAIANARRFDFSVLKGALHIYDVLEDRSIILKRDGTWDIE
jgi:hypothetical protein